MEAARKRHASQHPHSPEPQRRRLLDELEVCPVMNALRLQEADDSIEHEETKREKQAAIDAILVLTDDARAEAFKALRVEPSKEMRAEAARLREDAAIGASFRAAIAQARKHFHFEPAGRQTYQTLLAAAFYGESERIPITRTAAVLGIGHKVAASARERAIAVRDHSDLPPSAAIENGVYWYGKRAERTDATRPELLSLMRQYWHCDEVSRAAENSDGDEMWRESDAEDAQSHPRRQLVTAHGEEVYKKSLEWGEYLTYKANQGQGFTGPGRSLFLSTRCKCLYAAPRGN